MASFCKVCTKTTNVVCSGCKRIYYCNINCQRKDWKNHKKLCEKWKHSTCTNKNKQPYRWSQICNAIYTATMADDVYLQYPIRSVIRDYVFCWEWNPDMTFGIDLSNNNTKLSHTKNHILAQSPKGPSGEWMTTRGSLILDGDCIYEWDIKAIDWEKDSGDIIIGVLADDGHNPQYNDYSKTQKAQRLDKYSNEPYNKTVFIDQCKSWSYHSYNTFYSKVDGKIRCNDTSADFGGTFGGTNYGKPFFKNDVVTTIYNAKTKMIYYKINGDIQENGKEAFKNVSGDIIPFVTIFENSACAQLIDIRVVYKT